jgi:hypothetical protein
MDRALRTAEVPWAGQMERDRGRGLPTRRLIRVEIQRQGLSERRIRLGFVQGSEAPRRLRGKSHSLYLAEDRELRLAFCVKF